VATTLRRRLVDWSLAAVFLLIPALVLRASLRPPEDRGTVDKAVMRVTRPLQAGTAWLVDRLGRAWDRYIGLVGVEEENEELRERLEKSERQLAIMARKAYDIEELEDLAQLKRQTPADTIGARVTAASLSPFYRVVGLRLDRGRDEVDRGMPVITSQGLVGRIEEAYGRDADVLLLTDARSSVEVEVKRTGRPGIVRGEGKPDRYACKIEWVERASEPGDDVAVKVGDELFTSGLGGAFPAGIKVGTVRKVTTRDYQMFEEVEVEPAVDLSRVRMVLVLLAPPPPPDPAARAGKRSEPAFSVRPY
jgi:rod shape-determining protein MreC